MVKIFWMIVGATLVPLGYEFLRTKKYLRPRGLDLRQLWYMSVVNVRLHQVAHLDMAETDPDLDQDFPKMSIS